MLELISAFTVLGLFLLAAALSLLKSLKTKHVSMLKPLYSPTGKAFEDKSFVFPTLSQNPVAF